MPVCLALLNSACSCLLSTVFVRLHFLSFYLQTSFAAAGLGGVDPLPPEVVMSLTRGNVHVDSVYISNLCAFLHV